MGLHKDLALQKKHHELTILIHHIRSCLIADGNGEESSLSSRIVLSRLLAEVRRIEVEQVRSHVLNCPGLAPESEAYQIAFAALEESLDHIHRNEDLLDSSQLSATALTASVLGQIIHHGNTKEDDAVEDSDSDLSLTDNTVTSDSSPVKAPSTRWNRNTKMTDTSMSTTTTTSSSSSSSLIRRLSSFGTRFMGSIFRCLFLDLPLLFTCLFFVTSYCSQNIYHTYYVPIMESLTWTDERRITESTNYMRLCDRSDISTLNSDDFIIDPNLTAADEAVEITNKHGMSIFPNLLKPETAAAMREYVLRKNYALTEDEAIWLISNNQRWSFPIGADDDPSVPPVLQEIATHESFQKAIEALMGEDPAMVEFTAITSAYGAADQHWHADNDYTASQMHYARSFVPMYSLFIPLQDTTAKMGATSACPGTHLCGNELGLSTLCEELNFQVTDSRGRLAEKEEDHVWKAGDGFLMNLNTYHRGPGHTDENATERVMLILTISPRPTGPYFDRRQISLGTSYSCKWDMWGLTMKDLAVMHQIKGFPWKVLRTLGIYKHMGSHRNRSVLWGWDYLTVMCSRIVNDQMGFRWDDLHVFSERMKKKSKVLYYLFGQTPNEDGLAETELWPKYFEETLAKCLRCSATSFALCGLYYLVLCLFQKRRMSFIQRGLFIISMVMSLGFAWLYMISVSPWAQDIRGGLLYQSPFPELDENDVVIGEVTLPVKGDILFPSRIDSPFLAGHNLIYNHQPGNAHYYQLLTSFSVPRATPSIIVKGIVENVINAVERKHGRFLKQNVAGDWEVMEKDDIVLRVQKDLVAKSNPILQKVDQEIKYLVSETMYGRSRNSIMSRKHSIDNLSRLEASLFRISLPKEKPRTTQSLTLRLFAVDAGKIRRLTIPQSMPEADELKEGDIVECHFENDGWFKGRIEKFSKRNRVEVLFDDGDYQIMPLRSVRKFEHLRVGEEVGVIGSDIPLVSTITHIYADGQVSIEDEEGNEHDVHVLDLFRI